jgi:2,3-bisphosphoglycerate-dependent phosphoglycerate mutase
MDLLVIRHGQSEADILNVIEGRADFNLTELGVQQAILMAQWIKGYINIDKIISSTLKRASQTAQKLSETTNAPIEFDEQLMEWQNGLIAGLTFAEANEKYPEPKKFPHTAVFEQESQIAFRARAELVLSKIIHENPSESKMAIISHGNMINKLFQSFLERPVNSSVHIKSGDTGIHHWSISGNSREIILTGSLVHLL